MTSENGGSGDLVLENGVYKIRLSGADDRKRRYCYNDFTFRYPA